MSKLPREYVVVDCGTHTNTPLKEMEGCQSYYQGNARAMDSPQHGTYDCGCVRVGVRSIAGSPKSIPERHNGSRSKAVIFILMCHLVILLGFMFPVAENYIRHSTVSGGGSGTDINGEGQNDISDKLIDGDMVASSTLASQSAWVVTVTAALPCAALGLCVFRRCKP